MKREIKIILSRIKKIILTFGGIRRKFRLNILEQDLTVDYNLSRIKADRDYKLISQIAKDKHCFFDVGANHGAILLILASANPQMKIHAFEASENAVNIINKNVLYNKLEHNVRVVNALIADCSGYAIPFYWQNSSGGASITKGRLGHNIEIYKSTLSLDDYCYHFNLKPDFIKMDIEGAENIAIKGMKNILKEIRPLIFLELHAFGEKLLYENAQDILYFISPFSYSMIYLRTGKPVTDTSIIKDRGRCHVLLKPNEIMDNDVLKDLDLKGL